MFRGTFTGVSFLGAPPRNSNAATCASTQARWVMLTAGRTNRCREYGSTIDPAAVIFDPGRRNQHRRERLAAAAGQPLARIARLYWDDPAYYLRDPDGFRRMLRPACRRCTARRGIAGPVACCLPPHLTVCRRHRLWIGPSARTHAGQLDISPFPEILGAQRRHLTQLRQYQWQEVEVAVSDATRAIYQALRAGIWIPGQRQRMRQLAPGTWNQALAGVLGASPGRPDDGPGHPVVEIAIYPDVVWLAARSLRARDTSHREAS